MFLECRESPPCTSSIYIPCLRDVGVRGADLTDEGVDTYATENHGEGNSLGQAILDMQ